MKTASQEAFEAIQPRLSGLQTLILSRLMKGDKTIKDVRVMMTHNTKKYYEMSTVSTRFSELEAMGIIEKTDQRKNGETVWEIVPLERRE